MEIVAGVILGWVVVYLLTAVFMLRAYFAGSRNAQFLDLALMSLGLVAYASLSIPFHLTTDADQGALFTRIQVSFAPLLLALLFDFTMRFAGRREVLHRWLARSVFLAAAVLGSLVAAGLAYDPSRPVIHSVHVLGIDGAYHEHATTPLGIVVLAFSVGIVVVSAVVVGRSAARRRANALPVFAGCALFLATVFNDALVNSNVYHFLYLGAHGYLFLLLGFVYTQFERTMTLAADLGRRTLELEAANRELEGVYQSLRQSYDSLSRTREELSAAARLADLGRMAASLAHEIRNPLCVLSNVAAGLRRHHEVAVASVEERTLLTALTDEVSRLDRLVDDLLAFARPDKRSRSRVSLPMVADQAIFAVVSASTASHKYEMQREYESPPPKAMIDVERVRRALINLLTNAVQAMPQGGTVTVLVRRGAREGEVAVGVRDTGPGIRPEDLEKIFTPFYSTKPSGTGLGLSIVKSIAEEHEGRVEVENKTGQGATFWIHLCCDAAVADARAGAAPA
jgi:signal transduction histidine kinase